MDYEYGWWPMAIVNIGLFGAFAYGFLRPRTGPEWRTLGVFSAFLVALFAEMYGFPLTIYLLASWLGRLPFENPFSHMSGNLWASLLLSPALGWLFMGQGGLFMAVGLGLLAAGWRLIHRAKGDLVTTGVYDALRHPQYLGLVLFVVGALIQWPTLITLAMFPFLLVAYYRLAGREDRALTAQFGEPYQAYRGRVPGFWPGWRKITQVLASELRIPVRAEDPTQRGLAISESGLEDAPGEPSPRS